MPRTKAPGRLGEIVEAATQTFLTHGYRLAVVEQIADAAGVSPATPFLYAQSKAALFDLVIRRAFGESIDELPLPHRMPAGGSLVDIVVAHLRRADLHPLLDAAAAGTLRLRPRAAFEAVTRELYHLILRYHRAIALAERCGRDWPELQMIFRHELRARLLDQLQRYLARGMRARGSLRRMPDVPVAARGMLELIAWFAMHRFTAADTSAYDDAMAEETVVAMLVNAFVPSAVPS